MSRAYLIIQKVSFDHITHIAKFIHDELVSNFNEGADLIICDEIDDIVHDEGAIIFVIGEGFKAHQRRPGCLYVYLNFSIVSVLGNPLNLSKVGWSAIRRKRRMLCEKKAYFDVVLDYFAPQTPRLKQLLNMPVFGFNVAVDPNRMTPTIPFQDRPFDVCFVGSLTPRRQKILNALKACGLQLSPHNGVVYEDVAAQSRCCINIHAHRSNHLETPRIIGAIAAGTPIITEPCYGLDTVFPDDIVSVARLGNLVEVTQALCNDIGGGQNLIIRGQDWYKNTYMPSCRASWKQICTHLSQEMTT